MRQLAILLPVTLLSVTLLVKLVAKLALKLLKEALVLKTNLKIIHQMT